MNVIEYMINKYCFHLYLNAGQLNGVELCSGYQGKVTAVLIADYQALVLPAGYPIRFHHYCPFFPFP